MVAIIPFSSSPRNPFITKTSMSQPMISVSTNVASTAARKGSWSFVTNTYAEKAPSM